MAAPEGDSEEGRLVFWGRKLAQFAVRKHLIKHTERNNQIPSTQLNTHKYSCGHLLKIEFELILLKINSGFVRAVCYLTGDLHQFWFSH